MKTTTLQLGAQRVRLSVFGSGDATILALHGFGSTGMATFGELGHNLATAGYRIVVPDLPGFGGSSPIDQPHPYSLAGYSLFIRQLADELGVASAAVIGHSMGGKIALAAAVDDASRFNAVVLINTGGFSFRERILASLGHLSAWYRILDAPIGRRIARGLGLAHLTTTGARRQVREFRFAHPRMDLRRSGYWARLPDLRAPTLLIWGARDRMLPRSTPASVARALADVSVHYVEAGHTPAAEQPTIVATSIDIFLRSAGKPTS